jgi:hypothetical protein
MVWRFMASMLMMSDVGSVSVTSSGGVTFVSCENAGRFAVTYKSAQRLM